MNGIDEAKIHIEGDGLRIITQNGYGYGDIIRLMSYAERLAEISERKVHVTYAVESSYFEDKIHTVLNHYNISQTYNVEVVSVEKYAHKYTNLLKKEYAKQVSDFLGRPKLRTKHESFEGDYLCVWTPWKNMSPISSDKMPINKDTLDLFLQELDIPVKLVDYRMKIQDVFTLIRNSKLCMGYEGMGQQIAYHYNKNLISLSNLVEVSKNTGGTKSLITNDLNKAKEYMNVY